MAAWTCASAAGGGRGGGGGGGCGGGGGRVGVGVATAVVWAAALVAVGDGALFLPGVSPATYGVGQSIPLRVNSLRSTRNVMPMDWYSMPWCAPAAEVRRQLRPRRNLGEVLWGDNVEISLYEIRMMANVTCALVCPAMRLTVRDNEVLRKRIEEGYRGHMILDGLPVAEEGSHEHSRLSRTLSMGFPIGMPARLTGSRAVVFNHLAFTVLYHPVAPTGYLPGEDDADTFRVVGFVVTPLSIDHAAANYACGGGLASTGEAPPVFADAREVSWSYSVQFEFSDVEWSTRWDVYLKSSAAESRIHWFAIVNSLVVVGVLSAVIALILLRALRRDIARYNDPEALQEEREETGWKLVHGDVFRRPPRLGLLSVLVGSGMQVLCMCGAALLVACVGFASPQRRGSVLSVLIFLYVLLGFVGGFTTAVLANSFKVRSWRLIFATGALFPGTMFVAYFALNLIHWGNRAASATPVATMVALLVLWLFVSLPLVLLGGGSGYRTTLTYPRHVLTIARTVPPQPWQVSTAAALLLPGIFPFGASFVEGTFILGSVWQGRVYHVFGFLALSFAIAAVTAAEATVVLVYVQLLQLDYRWWWKSFFAGGSLGVWVLLFSVVYYRVLPIAGWWASLLYFGYMGMAAYVLFVMMGALCFCVTLAFVRVIYASLKID